MEYNNSCGTHPSKIVNILSTLIVLLVFSSQANSAQLECISTEINDALNAISTTDEKNIFVAGGRGRVLHHNGKNWVTLREADIHIDQPDLLTILAFSPTSIYAGGKNPELEDVNGKIISDGELIFYDGESWSDIDYTGLMSNLVWITDIAARDQSEIYVISDSSAAGSDVILFDGAEWTSLDFINFDQGFGEFNANSEDQPVNRISELFITPDGDVYAYGTAIYRFDIDKLAFVQVVEQDFRGVLGSNLIPITISHMWGSSSSNVVVISGGGGTMADGIAKLDHYKYDGTSWTLTRNWEAPLIIKDVASVDSENTILVGGTDQGGSKPAPVYQLNSMGSSESFTLLGTGESSPSNVFMHQISIVSSDNIFVLGSGSGIEDKIYFTNLPKATITSNTTGGDTSSGTLGDPISTFTGELFTNEPADFNLGGPMPLVFSRYYAAFIKKDDKITSALGANWLHSFDWVLNFSREVIEVINNHGRVIRFEDSDSTASEGVWDLIVNKRVPFQLVRGSTNEFILVDQALNGFTRLKLRASLAI